MATVTGLTKDRMLEIEAASIVSGSLDASGHLILTTHGGTTMDAGYFGLSANTITVATDFNTLTKPGAYLFTDNTVVAASANLPNPSGIGWTSGQAGFLLVEGNGTTFVKQTWTNYLTPSEVASRTLNNTAWSTWLPPVKAASTTRSGIATLATAAEVAAGTDASKVVTPSTFAAVVDKLPKGLMWFGSLTVTTGNVAATPTVILNVPSFTFKANRKYHIVWSYEWAGSVAGNYAAMDINSCAVADSASSVTGITKMGGSSHRIETSSGEHGEANAFFFPTADTTLQLKATMNVWSGSGTVNMRSFPTNPATLTIRDLGNQY